MTSRIAIIVIAVIWTGLGAWYYPKWKLPQTEATISWDVSGYYHYLPALFIYHDIRKQNWMEEIHQRYLPSAARDQAYEHAATGNKVNKYPVGQAVLLAPFFFMAHAYATLHDAYPADGYSRPYQAAIWLGGIIISILGLILLRKLLSDYVEDRIIIWVLLTLGLGTNWMEYAAVSNGMTHTSLFTILCLLCLSTKRFYEKQDWVSASGIGFSLGLATIVRPTEAIWVLVPLLWSISSLKERFGFLWRHRVKIGIALGISFLLISIQLVYWKYATGQWFVYTYQDQKLNLLRAIYARGLFGANFGWWLYTPVLAIAMLGWWRLYQRHRPIFWPIFITFLCALHITFSWRYFETGGGLGQRNLIQIYPLVAFPLAVVIGYLLRQRIGKWIWVLVFLCNLYYTGWWFHQAHRGGFHRGGQMTYPYFFSIVGRWDIPSDVVKLLDTNEYFSGEPKYSEPVLKEDFNADSTAFALVGYPGERVVQLSDLQPYYGPIEIPLPQDVMSWVRFEADFVARSMPESMWNYAQWVIDFYQDDQKVKSNMIRLHRMIPVLNQTIHLHFDVRLPEQPFNRCTMTLWNADSPQTLEMDNLEVRYH